MVTGQTDTCIMIMGSPVRIRLAAPFDIVRFVRNLLFPFFKNSKSDVYERGHRLRSGFGLLFWQITGSGKKLLRLWFTTPRIRKNMFFLIKIS